jgi:hypothetical protein
MYSFRCNYAERPLEVFPDGPYHVLLAPLSFRDPIPRFASLLGAFFDNLHINIATTVKHTIPPTTPPKIAPLFDFEGLAGSLGVGVGVFDGEEEDI